MYTVAERKEMEYLYKRHNTKWKGFELDIEQSKIVFPKNVSKIINKEKPLTDREKEVRKKFRQNVWRDLGIQSFLLQQKCLEEKEKEHKAEAKRKRIELDERNTLRDDKIKHFGVWKIKKDSLKINRDTYAEIDNKSHQDKNYYQRRYKAHYDIYSKIFTDETCQFYTDEWCIKHREDCLENFDLNMKFMNNLSKEKFEQQLQRLLNKYKDIREIEDLYEVEDIAGVYIMVLDEYKQMYIGQSENIKKRIENHWSRKKSFDKLIFGRIETSVLSIDCFGALDTTRIFVFPTHNTYEIERKLVEFVDSKYLLNRTAGGIAIDSEYEKLEVLANMNVRKLKQG